MDGRCLWAVLLVISIACYSQGVHNVRTAEELLKLFSKGKDVVEDIVLEGDLDFSTISGPLKPLGKQSGPECVKFSATFDGRGHTIRNYVIDQTSEMISMFCELGDATIQNLVIDNCKFGGQNSSVFCIDSPVHLTIRNVTNNAAVVGSFNSGAFISNVRKTDSVITLENCVNSGNLRGDIVVGGLIGSIYARGATVTISNCSNTGPLVGGTYSGGFIGILQSTDNSHLVISNSYNNCTIQSLKHSGGFFASITGQTNVSVSIEDCHNFGLTDETSLNAGGFIGSITGKNENLVVDIKKSTNSGTIRGSSFVGGLIGSISPKTSSSVKVLISSCTNHGDITGTSTSNMTCGFFCVGHHDSNLSLIQLRNSLSSGTVTGVNSYGFANSVSDVSNVIAMCTVSGSTNAFSFWENQSKASLFYGLQSTCKHCDSDVTFSLSNEDGLYYLETANESLEKMLNREASRYELVWNSKLELTEGALIKIGSPFLMTLLTPLGSSLDYVSMLGNVSFANFTVLDRKTGTILQADSRFMIDTDIMVCHTVITTGLISGNVYVEYGRAFEDTKNFSYYAKEQYGIVDAKNTSHEYSFTSPVFENMTVILIRKVIVTAGVPLSKQLFVLPGQKMDTFIDNSLFQQYNIVNRSGFVSLGITTVFDYDTSLAFCIYVAFIHKSFAKELLVEVNETLSEAFNFSVIDSKYHIIESGTDNTTEIEPNKYRVTSGSSFFLCYKVAVSGEVNINYYIECGQSLGSNKAIDYYLSKNYFVLSDGLKPSTSYTSENIISSDITVILTAKCDLILDQTSCNSTRSCMWTQSKCVTKDRAAFSAGMIAGIVVGCVCAFAVVVCVLFFVYKRNRMDTKTESALMETQLFDTNSHQQQSVCIPINGEETLFQLVRQIGKGSFATVWMAQNTENGDTCAVKILNPNKEVVSEAQKEAQILQRLDTQFVVAVYGCGYTDGSMAIAMEYFTMGSLQNVLQEDKLPSNGRVPMLLDIAKAMAYLHSIGIIHRDLKPGNVLVRSIDPQIHPMAKFVSFSFLSTRRQIVERE